MGAGEGRRPLGMSESSQRYVTRGGEKLAAALAAFGLDVGGQTCLDLGSHAGGFVDCLLQHGAAKVYAVDPGYGILDYRLRRDARVVVCERTNALEYRCPEPCAAITIDVGWTPLRLILPAVGRSLAEGGSVVALVKPQYEVPKEWLCAGVVPGDRLEEALELVLADVTELGWQRAKQIESPLRGHGGNTEFLWLLRRGT